MNQDSSPKTHPKSFKPPTPEVFRSHVCTCMWGSLVLKLLGVRVEPERSCAYKCSGVMVRWHMPKVQ